MKRMQHGAIAENERECFGLITLREIDIELCGCVGHGLLNIWIDATIAVQDARDSSNTDICGFRDLFETYFGR